jgi:hypothetical protein
MDSSSEMARANIEWVVGGPGLAFETWVSPARVNLWNPRGLEGEPAVSHISRKTSEKWGTRRCWRG